MDIRTESRNVAMAPRWHQEIEVRLYALQDGHEDILHARMTLEKNLHHKKGPKIATARLVCNVRGGTFTASKTEKRFAPRSLRWARNCDPTERSAKKKLAPNLAGAYQVARRECVHCTRPSSMPIS